MLTKVKIRIEDEDSKVLKHHYIRVDTYDLPAGNIEKEETPKQAAVRELLERTGYQILEINLEEIGVEGDFLLFMGKKKDLVEISTPGERGGYSSDIKWE